MCEKSVRGRCNKRGNLTMAFVRNFLARPPTPSVAKGLPQAMP